MAIKITYCKKCNAKIENTNFKQGGKVFNFKTSNCLCDLDSSKYQKSKKK